MVLYKDVNSFFEKSKKIVLFSIANLNSTLIWNLILQIPLHLTVEFNLSQISVKLSINMSVSSRQEGSTYE